MNKVYWSLVSSIKLVQCRENLCNRNAFANSFGWHAELNAICGEEPFLQGNRYASAYPQTSPVWIGWHCRRRAIVRVVSWDQDPQLALWWQKKFGEGSEHSPIFFSPRSFSLHNPNCGAWSQIMRVAVRERLSFFIPLSSLIYFFDREREVSWESCDLIGSGSGQYFPISGQRSW